MKICYFIFILYVFGCCTKNKKETNHIDNSNFESNKNKLVIVFNREDEKTKFESFSNNVNKDFFYKRENFDPPYDDPNLHISVFHGLDQDIIQIKRRELDQMNVWFDSEMGYMDWFRLNFEKYYIIYQDEYLMKGSLDPEHLFTAYEVKIHTGGVE